MNRTPRERLASVGLLVALAASCTRSPDAMARHFNALAAEEESQPDRVVKSLDLRLGDQVADLGAGGGFFTLRLAAEVGATGKVYAVELEQGYLDFIGRTLRERGIKNVELVLGTPQNSSLPAGSLDLVFVRNAFHDMERQEVYFSGLRAALRPNGRVVVIDYTPGGLLGWLHGHWMPEDEVVTTMEKAGYSRIRRYTFLSRQSFNVFRLRARGEP